MVSIIQHGTDGFGHQIHGLFTCMLMHGVNDFIFDGHEFLKKPFSFEHITSEQSEATTNYMKEVVSLFLKENEVPIISYKKNVFSYEIWNILNIKNKDILYSIDNVFYPNRINFDPPNKLKFENNIEKIKKYFINKYLPKNRLDEKNVVIHVRLGDAITTGRGGAINNHNLQILTLLDILKEQFPDHVYYIHSDGNVNFLTSKLNKNKQRYHLFEKQTDILQVTSDLIHSNVFVCGISSLSEVCSFLGDSKKLIIDYNANNKFMPLKNTHKISKYITEKARG